MKFSELFSRRADSQDQSAISFDELVKSLEALTCVIVDVREPNEFAAGRIPGSVNHPLSRFDPRRLPGDKPLVLVCRSGARSASALRQARAAGRQDVRHYAGGVIDWHRRGGDIEA